MESEHEGVLSSAQSTPVKPLAAKRGKYDIQELGDAIVALTAQANNSKKDKAARATLRGQKAHNPVFAVSASIIAEIARLGGAFNSVAGTLTCPPPPAAAAVDVALPAKRKRTQTKP